MKVDVRNLPLALAVVRLVLSELKIMLFLVRHKEDYISCSGKYLFLLESNYLELAYIII